MTAASRDTKAGTVKAKQRVSLRLPPKGRTFTYILTCAQNATGLHEACWANLQALADHDGADILVSTFTYAVNSRAAAGQKKTAKEPTDTPEVWDERLEPFIADHSIEIAPGLVWCGELQILPTAVNPIAGLESYTGRASSIIPHPQFAVESIASPKFQGTKLIYTTGCVTLRNYIQKKVGQKAEFHHGYGALIVEVLHDGTWFVRQLNADSDGVLHDLDRRVSGGRVSEGHRVDAVVWGDIHARQMDSKMATLSWGPGGILDVLRPRRQVLHDILDFRSQNHHDRKDPWKTYVKHCAGKTNVADEVAEVAAFLAKATRGWCETAIVQSNHDEALVRWLKEADYREDPDNAEWMLAATWRAYRAMKAGDDTYYPLADAVARASPSRPRRVRWLRRDEEYVVCPDAGGGIELGMHGDIGVNGSRGSLPTFAKTGRKCIVAHSHTAGLRLGAMQVGVSGSLDMGYNTGQSAWSHTHAIVYPNGKRTLFTVWNLRWRG